MKSLLTLLATGSLISSLTSNINEHQVIPSIPANITKVVSNIEWKFTKTNKDIQNLITWNSTSSIFKEQKTNKLFFINPNGEIKDINLYNSNPNPNGYAKIISNNYIIIIGNTTVSSQFKFFLVNKDYKFVDLNSFDALKNIKIQNTQVIDSTHIIIIDDYNTGFLLTINNEKINVRKLNITVLDVKKISNNLIAITTQKIPSVGDITIIYDIVNNKQTQEFDDIIFTDIKMFNEQKGVLTTSDLKTYWITNNNYFTLKLLDFASIDINFLNNRTIITTNKTSSYQINIDGSISTLKHGGDFCFCNNNLGVIFNYNETYLVSQEFTTNELNYNQIKVNNLPINYFFVTKVVVVDTNYLMFSAYNNAQYKSYVIDKNGNNIRNFPTNYLNFGAINADISIVFDLSTNKSDFLTFI